MLENNMDLSFALKEMVNSSPNDKILDWSKLKVFADDKIKLAKMMIFVFDTIENIVGKGENAGNQHFLLFPQCFQKAFYSGSLEVGIAWKRVIYISMGESNTVVSAYTLYRHLQQYCSHPSICRKY